jgi:hypothetical protein
MPKKIAGKPATDTTLPNVPVKIGGHEYHLAFTYGSLATAERKAAEAGLKINALEAIDFSDVNATKIQVLFFAALQAQHPNLSFEEASNLLTLQNSSRVYSAVVKAYISSMSEPDEDAPKDPTVEPSE